MGDWSSLQYLKFQNERTQPAIDLAARVIKYAPKTVADIGCGPGNSTAVLKGMLPDSHIIGIDNSLNMIERAKNDHPELEFALCDALSLEGKYDMLFSNACLQWIPNHCSLIPDLMKKLSSGGVLAVQIPMNGDEPLYKAIDELAASDKWHLNRSLLRHNMVLDSMEYFNILSKCSSSFDIWETVYYHRMPNHHALVEWVKGTRLRPYLELMSEEQGREFENEIERAAVRLYPVMDNGEVVLKFRRLFFTAVAD